MLGSGAFAGVTRSGDFYEGNELEEQQAQFFEDATIRNQTSGNSDVYHTNEDLTGSIPQFSGSDARSAKGMPLFKKYRIKSTHPSQSVRKFDCLMKNKRKMYFIKPEFLSCRNFSSVLLLKPP